ncbi:hypothetical protein [Synechococcus lacustris]|uniref:Uncharacterized protein n=1 Tax=Synechococcus lacustris str. Tous TaxID=1910958 RepID=A0A2P7EF71_9SYNE|nr:hypothetical protein [Synechococcus lacustris]PSI01892.1 hypothetical protein C7K08_05785 [Synechococcus lacustris str. Tous]
MGLNSSNNPNYCQRVTADDGKLGNTHLKNFQDNEKTVPTILTTSQKLTPLLQLRYQKSISDAVADLGKAEEIGILFSSFQKYLYEVAN